MKKDTLKEVARTLKEAQSNLNRLTQTQRENLEEGWDLEHAYYSSALEGSMVDREDVERLSRIVK